MNSRHGLINGGCISADLSGGFIALAAGGARVGVLVFGLLSIAGQLLGSVILDLAAPAEGITFGWPQWLALGLIALATLIATNLAPEACEAGG